MKISIIIPTLNEEKQILRLLNAIKEQSIDAHEIIVVDCGSEDKTQDLVRSVENVNLVITDRGVGHQRHTGAQHATGDLLIFFDADVAPHEDFVKNVLEKMNAKKIDILCPRYVPDTNNVLIKTIFTGFHGLFYCFQQLSPSGAGMCIVVRKDHYHHVGGFKKELTYDDIAFIRKAARKGKFHYGSEPLLVSARRFEQQGILRTTGKYGLLSLFFLTGQFKLANLVEYKFGMHE